MLGKPYQHETKEREDAKQNTQEKEGGDCLCYLHFFGNFARIGMHDWSNT